MTCPECGIDGGNGGLGHTSCCEREIEIVEEEIFNELREAAQEALEHFQGPNGQHYPCCTVERLEAILGRVNAAISGD